MKKILLILCIALSSTTFSQIETTPASKEERVGKVQHFECSKLNGVYTFIYNDYKYSQINVYKEFEISEEDFHYFFNTIVQGFEDVPEQPILVETPNDLFRLKYVKMFGTVNLQILHSVRKNPDVIGLSKNLTEKAVFKLFGIKK